MNKTRFQSQYFLRVGTSEMFILIASFAAIYLWWLFKPRYQLGMINDDAFYYLNAQSIIHHIKMGHLFTIGKPLSVHHPLGLSLLIAPLVWLFPDAVPPVQAVSLVSLILALILLQRLVRGEFDGLNIGLLVLWTALHPTCTRFSVVVMAELPFMALSFLALWLEKRTDSWSQGLLVPVLAALVWFKVLGLTLVAAVTIERWRQNRKNEALALFCLVLLLISPWFYISQVAYQTNMQLPTPSYMTELSSYLHSSAGIGTLLQSFLQKGIYYSKFAAFSFLFPLFTQAVWQYSLPIWGEALLAVSMFFTIMGYFWTCRKSMGTMETYVAFFVASLLLWPSVAWRYMIPIGPFLMLYLIRGIQELTPNELKSKAATSVLVISILCELFFLVKLNASHQPIADSLPLQTMAWMDQNLPKDAVVASEAAPIVRVYTHRQAFFLPWLPDPDLLIAFFELHRITHVLLKPDMKLQTLVGQQLEKISSATHISAYRLITDSPVFRQIYNNPSESTMVYEVVQKAPNYEEANRLGSKAVQELVLGHLEEAKRLYEEELRQDPRLFASYQGLGGIYAKQWNLNKAAEILEHCRKEWPTSPAARYNLGWMYWELGKIKAAETEISAAVTLAQETAAGIDEDAQTLKRSQSLLESIEKRLSKVQRG